MGDLLGLIENLQKNLFNGRFVGTDRKSGVTCPNFVKLSKAFGIQSSELKSADKIELYLKNFLNKVGPALLEVHMDKNQEFTPKLTSYKNEKGIFISPKFDEMSPR